MNAKKAKALRKTIKTIAAANPHVVPNDIIMDARSLTLPTTPDTKEVINFFKNTVTGINHPHSVRGVYRAAKKKIANGELA